MLASDKQWDDTQWLEGQGDSTDPQPVAQRHAVDTAAQSKSCGDELEAPEVVGANKEAFVKHPKGNKQCSSVNVMAHCPDEVPLHEHTQHGKQTGTAGSCPCC